MLIIPIITKFNKCQAGDMHQKLVITWNNVRIKGIYGNLSKNDVKLYALADSDVI